MCLEDAGRIRSAGMMSRWAMIRSRNAAWKMIRNTQKTGLCARTCRIPKASRTAARPGRRACG
jgi:hypothetical protein